MLVVCRHTEYGLLSSIWCIRQASEARSVNKERPEQDDTGSQPSVGTRLEQVCDAFESRWRSALDGESDRPEIERFLEGVSANERWAFLRELILTDQQ